MRYENKAEAKMERVFEEYVSNLPSAMDDIQNAHDNAVYFLKKYYKTLKEFYHKAKEEKNESVWIVRDLQEDQDREIEDVIARERYDTFRAFLDWNRSGDRGTRRDWDAEIEKAEREFFGGGPNAV